MQRRYSGPNAEAVARRLPGSSNRPDHDGRWRLRGYCHGHGDKRDSASLTVQDHQDGGITVHCFAGCQRREIITALEQVSGLTIWDAWDSSGQAQHRVSIPQGVKLYLKGQKRARITALRAAWICWQSPGAPGRRLKSFLQTRSTRPAGGWTPGTSGAPVFPCPAP